MTGPDPAEPLLPSRGRLLQYLRDQLDVSMTQLRTDPRQRLIALVLALLIEAGLVLVVLSLGLSDGAPPKPTVPMVSVAIEAEPAKTPAPKTDDPVKPAAARKTPQKPPPGAPTATNPVPAPPASTSCWRRSAWAPVMEFVPVPST